MLCSGFPERSHFESGNEINYCKVSVCEDNFHWFFIVSFVCIVFDLQGPVDLLLPISVCRGENRIH